MGNYSSAVVTMVPGSDGVPEGAQVYRARVTTPPAWRRGNRPAARTRPVVSAPIPLAPIDEDEELSSMGGRRRMARERSEDCDSLEEVLGGLERMIGQRHLDSYRDERNGSAEPDSELYGTGDLYGSERDAEEELYRTEQNAEEELYGTDQDSSELYGSERDSLGRLPWDPTEPEPEPEPSGASELCSWERQTSERSSWAGSVSDEPVPRDAGSERAGGGGGGESRRGRLFLVQGTETRRRYRANRRLSAEQRRRALRDPEDEADEESWSGSVRRRRSDPRGEAGQLLVRHRRERRQAACAREAVKRWYLPWLRDGYLASGDEEEPPPDDDDDTRRLSYIAAQRAAEQSAMEAARPLRWHAHTARYATHATIEFHGDDLTGDPGPTLSSGLTSDLTEVILRRGQPPEAVRSEAELLDTRSELYKERCIDHYLEVYCSDRTPALTPARAPGPQDAAQLRRSLWAATRAPDGAIETGE